MNDKLNFVGPVRARTANEILKGFRSLEQWQSQIRLPILAVHGTKDRCTSLPVGFCLSSLAALSTSLNTRQMQS